MYGAGDVRVENVPVKLPVGEDSALLPSLLTLADVYGAGYHAAKRANVNPRTTVTVIGDGAVGLLALLGFRDDA
jgi:threonine dehydrogenase-like Zn-dependent dehydrogenase